MSRRLIALSLAFAASTQVAAETVLIRGARVHTVDTAGVLENSDVLIRDGLIAQIGKAIVVADARIVDANGKALTPGLFGGLTALGLEDVSAEVTTVDNAYTPGAVMPAQPMSMRPEFDLAYAYNPASMVIPVQVVEGITFTMLAPSAMAGGTLVGGQGGLATLDGRSIDLLPASRSLFIALGSGASSLTGNSRAAQYMLLDQAIRETRGALFEGERLLTVAGRETLAKYLSGGRVVLSVNRAIDIRRALAFAKKHGMRPVIVGGAEAWQVAAELASAKAPVLVDPFVNLPGNFDQFGATLENAARLHKAGVTVAFSQSGDASHMARKLRQGAGIAVANGLPWDAGLAAITANPAAIFGAGDRGRIAVGQRADLVLWDGDPLDVSSLATQVWIGGEAQPMVSRQTLLRDRYAPKR
ncbi:MAG TPA: amidohydrolase family protein [Pseudomonadota bacterium]|nr:amidohydrolase family protein [Xanthomonadales bacterium]HQW80336.1 amidohydrolase family protein [Pseudomonadota bacterium]